MACVFNASNGKLKLSSTEIYTGLRVTKIEPKCALKCTENVYIHRRMQHNKSTHSDSLANWKIISKLFLLNYACLSGRFNNILQKKKENKNTFSVAFRLLQAKTVS